MLRFILCLFMAFATLAAAGLEVIALRDGLPESEDIVIGPKDNVRRLQNVTKPTLTVYEPAASRANGTAVIVCPGGGFRILAIDKEGIDVARWLTTLGITAFVLKYRVGHPDRALARQQAAEDGLLALKVVRERASEWKIHSQRIGIMGFSAGGYVAAAAGAGYGAANRPDFVAPIYPARPEVLTVPTGAPPLFLFHADDDGLSPASNSIPIYLAWKNAGAPAELHIVVRGGHGFGTEIRNAPTDTWQARLQEWLSERGLLQPAEIPRLSSAR
jgi:acetyl esterase/lipase